MRTTFALLIALAVMLAASAALAGDHDNSAPKGQLLAMEGGGENGGGLPEDTGTGTGTDTTGNGHRVHSHIAGGGLPADTGTTDTNGHRVHARPNGGTGGNTGNSGNGGTDVSGLQNQINDLKTRVSSLETQRDSLFSVARAGGTAAEQAKKQVLNLNDQIRGFNDRIGKLEIAVAQLRKDHDTLRKDFDNSPGKDQTTFDENARRVNDEDKVMDEEAGDKRYVQEKNVPARVRATNAEDKVLCEPDADLKYATKKENQRNFWIAFAALALALFTAFALWLHRRNTVVVTTGTPPPIPPVPPSPGPVPGPPSGPAYVSNRTKIILIALLVALAFAAYVFYRMFVG